jgi:hypothetical protein
MEELLNAPNSELSKEQFELFSIALMPGGREKDASNISMIAKKLYGKIAKSSLKRDLATSVFMIRMSKIRW